MKRSVLLRTVPVLLGALALGACGGSVEAGPATAQNAAGSKAPIAMNASVGHLKLVGEALGEVSLRPDQRTAIEQLAKEADARHAATKQARTDVANAVAAQVEAGKIDRAALQPKIDAAIESWKATRPADRAAFEKLHAILDKDQRSAFVDALVAKTREARHAGGHGKHEHMAKIAEDLKLTDAQKAQIMAIMQAQHAQKGDGEHGEHRGDWKEGREKGKAMLEAFKQDRFVIDEVAPAGDTHAKVNEMSGHFLGVVEQILPILTPEQRTLAATKVREHAVNVMEMAPAP